MLISIVVPIYNVSCFIDRGIQQLLSLTYKEIEILLVDDGSTDASPAMIDRWASQYTFITALHQKNAGAGIARQNGVDHAMGDYLWFYDIDDEIEPDLLERSLPYLDGELDILQFGYDTWDSKFNIRENCRFLPMEAHSNEEVKERYSKYIFGQYHLNGFVWNKIYRVPFLRDNNIRFQNQKLQQDEIFNLIAYKYVNNLRVIPDLLYHYFIYHKGNTRSFYIPHRLTIFQEVRDNFLSLYRFWDLDDKVILSYIYSRHIGNVIAALNFNLSKSVVIGRQDFLQAADNLSIQESMRQIHVLDTELSGFFKQKYVKALESKSFSVYFIAFIFEKLLKSFKSFTRFVKSVFYRE